jgi:hypothetical protein
LVYQRNQGDIWLFWTLMDRIPIAVGLIAVVFLGFRTWDWPIGLGFLAAMVVPLIATMPHRQGIAVSLDFLSRHYFRDPLDDMPPVTDDSSRRSS